MWPCLTALLRACPALRILDFSNFMGEFSVKAMRKACTESTEWNTQGAGRLTHVYMKHYFGQGGDVINVLDNSYEDEHGYDSHDSDETDPGTTWPRKFFFSKKGEVATLIASQEEEGGPYLMF